MTSSDPTSTFSLAGQMTRAPEDVARILNALVMRGELIVADLDGGKLQFRSKLRFVDPEATYIIIEPSSDEAASKALMARPRATFYAEPGGWRIEFAAADPKPTSAKVGVPGIKLQFPELISGHRRRSEQRFEAPAQVLRCVIDEGGVTPFDGAIANVSRGGIGFLQYDPIISLEPGTVLKGCRIENASGESIVVDMEVRYSQLMEIADGTQVQNSGCRFLNLSAEDAARIEEFFGLAS